MVRITKSNNWTSKEDWVYSIRTTSRVGRLLLRLRMSTRRKTSTSIFRSLVGFLVADRGLGRRGNTLTKILRIAEVGISFSQQSYRRIHYRSRLRNTQIISILSTERWIMTDFILTFGPSFKPPKQRTIETI